MALRPLRTVALPEATQAANDAWLGELDRALEAPGADWYRVCRDALYALWHPDGADYAARLADSALPAAARANFSASTSA